MSLLYAYLKDSVCINDNKEMIYCKKSNENNKESIINYIKNKFLGTAQMNKYFTYFIKKYIDYENNIILDFDYKTFFSHFIVNKFSEYLLIKLQK